MNHSPCDWWDKRRHLDVHLKSKRKQHATRIRSNSQRVVPDRAEGSSAREPGAVSRRSVLSTRGRGSIDSQIPLRDYFLWVGGALLVLLSAADSLLPALPPSKLIESHFTRPPVDFTDPTLPPGFNAEKINAGIVLGVKKIEEHGWKGDTCMITPDAAGSAMLEKALTSANYDCVVIGGGLRLPPKSLALFETVVNIIHKAAPNAAIAFNTQPADTADAAARQLKAT
jgi:hypothetical protein